MIAGWIGGLARWLMGFVLVVSASAKGPATADRLNDCRALTGSQAPIVAHGRLYAANGGGSGFRIWIVGTKRIVWLSPKIDPAIPDAVRNAFTPFDEDLYGDYTLVPLAPDRPGVMREVCFVSGTHLVAGQAAR